jgi:hypothetical protein
VSQPDPRERAARIAADIEARAAEGGGSLAAEAQPTDDGPGDLEANFGDVEGTDVDVLNYALTLELLEDAFYRQELDAFDAPLSQEAVLEAVQPFVAKDEDGDDEDKDEDGDDEDGATEDEADTHGNETDGNATDGLGGGLDDR